MKENADRLGLDKADAESLEEAFDSARPQGTPIGFGSVAGPRFRKRALSEP